MRKSPSESQNQCVDIVSSHSAIFLPYIVTFETANVTQEFVTNLDPSHYDHDRQHRPWSRSATFADAEDLTAASRGGVRRVKCRMIESMHVEEAILTIERFQHATGDAIS